MLSDKPVLAYFWSKTIFFTDLEDIFQQAGVGQDSRGLTHHGLSKVFGRSTPRARTMECFDGDKDRRYSLLELRAAVGLWAHYHRQQWTVLENPAGSGGSEIPTLLCNCCTFVNWIFIILIVEQWRWHAPYSPSLLIPTQPLHRTWT